jgi:hypothetical protein
LQSQSPQNARWCGENSRWTRWAARRRRPFLAASGGAGRRGGGPGLRWQGLAGRGVVWATRPAARRGAIRRPSFRWRRAGGLRRGLPAALREVCGAAASGLGVADPGLSRPDLMGRLGVGLWRLPGRCAPALAAWVAGWLCGGMCTWCRFCGEVPGLLGMCRCRGVEDWRRSALSCSCCMLLVPAILAIFGAADLPGRSPHSQGC